MIINIFLDDYRQPQEAYSYTKNAIYLTEKWEIAKNYPQFCKKLEWIKSKGYEIGIVSFDHDLINAHYVELQNDSIDYNHEIFKDDKNKTGYHCALHLVEHCFNNELKPPEYLCHSMNPIGKENILRILNFEFSNDD